MSCQPGSWNLVPNFCSRGEMTLVISVVNAGGYLAVGTMAEPFRVSVQLRAWWAVGQGGGAGPRGLFLVGSWASQRSELEDKTLYAQMGKLRPREGTR